MAIAALKKGEVQRIILTRPAVEAGESLGFLPGDLKEKVDPYLRPMYDALHQIFGVEHTNRLLERGVIEIAPLAYMRGRTLDVPDPLRFWLKDDRQWGYFPGGFAERSGQRSDSC